MTTDEYKQQRVGLMENAREMLQDGNAAGAEEIMDRVEELDAKFESSALAAANAAALAGGAKPAELKNLSRTVSGGKVVEKMENEMPKRENMVGTKEYKNAFLKTLLGRELTEMENVAYVHTTTQENAPVPTEMLNEIWDLIYGEHHILEDITIYRTGTIMEITKHTEVTQGKAKKVAEGEANDDEQNTFVKVTLSGKDFSKHVDISYAMQKMSIPAFETYLKNEIATGLGEELAKDVIAAIGTGMEAENKIKTAATGTVSYKDLAKLFGQLKRVGSLNIYATRKTIYNYLVGLTNDSGTPIFQQVINPGVEGALFGAQIKTEDAVADGTILVGDGKKFIFNMVQDIMVESAKDIKKHVVTHSGYARGEGALIDGKAFAQLTLSA